MIRPDYADEDVMASVANRVAQEFLPDTGPCLACDHTLGARHRVADAIVELVITALEIDQPVDALGEEI